MFSFSALVHITTKTERHCDNTVNIYSLPLLPYPFLPHNFALSLLPLPSSPHSLLFPSLPPPLPSSPPSFFLPFSPLPLHPPPPLLSSPPSLFLPFSISSSLSPLPSSLLYMMIDNLWNFHHVVGKPVTLKHVFHDLIFWTLKEEKKIAPIKSFPLYDITRYRWDNKQVFSVHAKLLLLHCTWTMQSHSTHNVRWNSQCCLLHCHH